MFAWFDITFAYVLKSVDVVVVRCTDETDKTYTLNHSNAHKIKENKS